MSLPLLWWQVMSLSAHPATARVAAFPPDSATTSKTLQAGYQAPAENPPARPDDPLVGQAELSVEQLVAEVQARNPSLQAAGAAWRAAADATRRPFRWTTRCSPT